MHSADYAVARCLSDRPSVRLSHAGILSKRLNIKDFSPSRSHTELHDSWPDPRVGSGRVGSGRVGSSWVKKITGKGGSGPFQFVQRLKFNFKLPWYLYFILHFSLYNVQLSCALHTQYISCSYQCVAYKTTWRMMNLCQRQHHAGTTVLLARSNHRYHRIWEMDPADVGIDHDPGHD